MHLKHVYAHGLVLGLGSPEVHFVVFGKFEIYIQRAVRSCFMRALYISTLSNPLNHATFRCQ